MKTIFFFLILFLTSINAGAQISGIPEQDSLLVEKDRLMILNAVYPGKYQLEYEWADFKWRMWAQGKVSKQCLYVSETSGGIFITSCPEPGSFAVNKIGDTLIHLPKPISVELFLNEKIKKALDK